MGGSVKIDLHLVDEFGGGATAYVKAALVARIRWYNAQGGGGWKASYREIGKDMRMSPVTARHYLAALVADGYVTKERADEWDATNIWRVSKAQVLRFPGRS